MEKVTRFSISIDKDVLDCFDTVAKNKGNVNRSKTIEDLMRKYVVDQTWKMEDATTAGTINFVYDHHTRELTHMLTELQHDFLDIIVSNLHVHLGHNDCMEVIVVKGASGRIRAIADTLASTRGVKYLKLNVVAAGT